MKRFIALRLPHAAPIALLCMALAMSGCTTWNWRGAGYDNSFTEWGGVERPADSESRPWGVSAKAREIERDLGVR